MKKFYIFIKFFLIFIICFSISFIVYNSIGNNENGFDITFFGKIIKIKIGGLDEFIKDISFN